MYAQNKRWWFFFLPENVDLNGNDGKTLDQCLKKREEEFCVKNIDIQWILFRQKIFYVSIKAVFQYYRKCTHTYFKFKVQYLTERESGG